MSLLVAKGAPNGGSEIERNANESVMVEKSKDSEPATKTLFLDPSIVVCQGTFKPARWRTGVRFEISLRTDRVTRDP